MNNNFILKAIRLWKMFNFTPNGDLEVKYAGSRIRLCASGDIIIDAKRHTIHNRDLFFDGCDQEFIDEALRANARGKNELAKYINNRTRTSEFNIDGNGNKNGRQGNSNMPRHSQRSLHTR